jgi:hypothetical protein
MVVWYQMLGIDYQVIFPKEKKERDKNV